MFISTKEKAMNVPLAVFVLVLLVILIIFWRRLSDVERLVFITLIALGGTALIFPNSAKAAEPIFWVEPQLILNEEKNLKRIDGGLAGNTTDKLGYFAFAQALSNGYAQAYAGPTLKFSCFEAGIGIGREDGQREWRRAATLSANCGNVSALAIVENGGTGHFHKYVLSYAVTDQLKVGFQEEKFLGRGPRIDYSIGKNAALWAAVLRDRNSKTTNTVLAVTLNF